MNRLIPLASAASLLLLVACQDSSPTSSAIPTDQASAQPVSSDIPEQPVHTASYRDQPQDRDNDGITDDEDPYPDAAPQTPLAGSPLRIDSLISPRANRDLPNVVMTSEPVVIDVTGLYTYGTPWWVRWHHAGGILAESVTPDSSGRLNLEAPELAVHGVSVVAGHYVTDTLPVRSQMARAPLLYPVEADLRAGQTVTLSGEYLDQVRQLSLGGRALGLLKQLPGSVTIRLPENPLSQRLTLEDARGRTHSARLPIVRPVRLSADQALDNPGAWQLMTDTDIYSLDEPVTYWVPAGETRILRFTHDNRNLSLLGLVLPTDDDVVMGGESTLSAWLWNDRTGQGGSKDIDFASIIPTLTPQLSSIHYRITDALNGDLQAIRESRDAFSSQSSQLRWEPAQPLEPTLRWGILDYVGDTIDAILAGGPLYEPIVSVANQRAKSGSDNYANIAIGTVRDLTSCDLLTSQPADVWPSDLCLENDSAVFVSAKVTDWRSDEVLADYINNPLDANIIAGTSLGMLNVATVSYLTGTGGSLCKMRPCKIDVLTGSLGMNTNSNLNARERQVADWLLARTLIERLIFPLFESITGLDDDSDTLTCFAEQLLKPSPTSTASFLMTVSDFAQKVAQSNSSSDVITHTKETVVPIILDKLQGVATDKDFAPCLLKLTSDIQSQVLTNITNRLEDAASSAALPLRIAEVVLTVYDQWEIYDNPRKIVFEVAPRAAITAMTTSGNSKRELYFDDEYQYLRLRGTQLVNPLDGGYWPDLSLKDGAGSQVSMPITQDHVFDSSHFAKVELHIPVPDLTPLVNQLGGSRFEVDLVYTHRPYTGFPNEVLVVPGTSFQWFGDARLVGLDTGLIRAGDTGVLRGENLERLNRPDLQILLFNANLGTFSAEAVGYVSGSKLVFTVPDYVPSGSYEVSVLPGDEPLLKAESNAQVLAANGSFIRLLDNGEHQDDFISMELENLTAGPLLPPGFETTAFIPTRSGAYDIWVGWEPGGLTDSSGQSQSLDITTITCIDGSEDGVCTVRLHAELQSGLVLDEQFTLGEGETLTIQ